MSLTEAWRRGRSGTAAFRIAGQVGSMSMDSLHGVYLLSGIGYIDYIQLPYSDSYTF